MKKSDSVADGSRRWRVAARHSDLARLQAYRFGEAVGSSCEFQFQASLGDKNLNDPLWKMPEKGVFTEDFVQDLISGKVDFVVHSYKDLPTEARAKTEIAATLARHDARDLILIRRDRIENIAASGQLRVFTSSPRRTYNLESFLKTYLPLKISNVEFVNVRGNIPTRLKKLMNGDVDALVVAKAAIDRLVSATELEFRDVQTEIRAVLQNTRFIVVPLSVNPTAAAQGALAIEVSKANSDAREVAHRLSNELDHRAVLREREILASHGGGCHQKIGVTVLVRPYGEITYCRGLTDAGLRLEQTELKLSSHLGRDFFASRVGEIYPRAEEGSDDFFERKALASGNWASAEKADLIWAARANVWPEELKVRDSAIVWTAGLKTWAGLARRGIWVNGTADGLGEIEDPKIENLASVSSKVKLSHDESSTPESLYELCATYQLVPREKPLDLGDRTHFFWKSGSAFKRALALHPGLRNRFHASGPGSTHDLILKTLNAPERTAVFLDVDDFRKALRR